MPSCGSISVRSTIANQFNGPVNNLQKTTADPYWNRFQSSETHLLLNFCLRRMLIKYQFKKTSHPVLFPKTTHTTEKINQRMFIPQHQRNEGCLVSLSLSRQNLICRSEQFEDTKAAQRFCDLTDHLACYRDSSEKPRS